MKIFIKTFIYRFDLDIFRGHVDGFGWSTKHHISAILWSISCIYFIMIFVNDNENDKISRDSKLVMLSVSFVLYCLIYLICFAGWTRLGSDMINGIQSRYFIPCLPLIYIGISNECIKLNVKNKYRLYTVLLTLVQILVVFTLIKSFY